MKKQGYNPYLPSWEYIPDGEPYVFNGRVYVYGSHDRFNGHTYCLNDYVCWSAPVNDLTDWHYEGVIYKKDQDPKNPDGQMCLYAPDITLGPDGRYYLYYVLNELPVVSVAVCDTPAGQFEFYGYVRYPDGTLLGEAPWDQPQFDPGVLTENGVTYLYTGFCMPDDRQCQGAVVTVLDADMVTVVEKPQPVVPGKIRAKGTGFEGHEFYEASSIRKIGSTYYFIYSSVLYHELCYAVSSSPVKSFQYGGVIVSNNDSYISTYKPAQMPAFYGGNNHGSIVNILGQWYIFYHRHTNGTNFSRQACLEPVTITCDGRILQAEMTSCGPNGGPLEGQGEYPAYLACNLFCKDETAYTAPPGDWMDCRFPKITQDGKDGDHEPGYIANMRDGAIAGFKYFDCKNITSVAIKTRGLSGGAFLVKLAWDGQPLGEIPVTTSNEWKEHTASITIPDGVHALYFQYRGPGNPSLASFKLITKS